MKEFWWNMVFVVANLAWAIAVYITLGHWWVALNIFGAGFCTFAAIEAYRHR